MSRRKGTTSSGRIIFGRTYEEEPKSARANKRYYQLWKFASTLELNEIEFLITKRKKELRYVQDNDEIRALRTEILILEDTYKIKRKEKEETK